LKVRQLLVRRARSADGRFGLEISEPLLDEMLGYCARAYPVETGGILIGHYSADSRFAHVTDLIPAPNDSISKRFSFQRGVRGIQRLLNQMWPMRRYCLGEWHFHPDGSASPSGTDADQMRSIAHAGGYHCPEPVLVIVGGNPPGRVTLQSYVFPRGISDAVGLEFEVTNTQGEAPRPKIESPQKTV
jgi:integrative and conjugative element protein (TIGR02256 family)